MSRPKLAQTADDTGSAMPSHDLQQLWFAAIRREWQSLVLVPSHPGGSARKIAKGLAEVGSLHRGSTVKLIHAEGLQMSDSSRMVVEMSSTVSSGGLVIVSMDSVVSNQAGIPLALAADAAILCVELGEADFTSARRTMELIGQHRVIGSVTVPAVRL